MSPSRNHSAWIALLALLLAVMVPATAGSQSITRFYGCYNCVENGGWGLTGPTEFVCEQVGNEETGEGIVCEQWEVWSGTGCSASGGECFNVDAPYEEPPFPTEPEGGI